MPKPVWPQGESRAFRLVRIGTFPKQKKTVLVPPVSKVGQALDGSTSNRRSSFREQELEREKSSASLGTCRSRTTCHQSHPMRWNTVARLYHGYSTEHRQGLFGSPSAGPARRYRLNMLRFKNALSSGPGYVASKSCPGNTRSPIQNTSQPEYCCCWRPIMVPRILYDPDVRSM